MALVASYHYDEDPPYDETYRSEDLNVHDWAPSLEPGYSVQRTHDVFVPAFRGDTAPTGAVMLGALHSLSASLEVDSPGLIPENNENDNRSTIRSVPLR